MQDKLQLEDTVSADRKERIVFDPDAWRKSDKSGRKTSAITSRQNFDNEKFTRKDEKQVDEGTIQPSGDSKVDSAGPTQSDTISQDKKVKKSNNPQIEFVTGTATPNGSSSTAIGGAQATGRKISESIRKTLEEKLNLSKMKMGDVVKDFQQSDAPQFKGKSKEKRQQMAVAAKLQADRTNEETDMSKTYADFIQQLKEYNAGKDGVYRHKGTYGGSYDSNDDEDDDAPKKPAAPAVKRGRGRPAGSKSGANQKVTTGKSYGGIATHSLNLPNSNR